MLENFDNIGVSASTDIFDHPDFARYIFLFNLTYNRTYKLPRKSLAVTKFDGSILRIMAIVHLHN
jgi:hypothetical protein